MAVTENESKLIAIFVQSCLWGAFAVMFVLTYWTLVYRRPRGRPLNVPMLSVAILMFVLATMQLGINFTRVIRGFIIHEGHTGDYYNVLAEFTQLFGSATFIVQTFVGDAVAIYRCYVVWSRRAVAVLLLCVLYTGSLVTGIGILVTMGQASDGSLVFADKLNIWTASFFSFTLVTSIICTLMIASRIWYLSNQSVNQGGRITSLHPVARIVVESGAIYSTMLIVFLILYGQKSWFEYVIVDTFSSLIGIVFSVIIVRIGLGIAIDPDTVQAFSSESVGGSTSRRISFVHQLSTFEASEGLSSDGGRGHVKFGLEKTTPSEYSNNGATLSHKTDGENNISNA